MTKKSPCCKNFKIISVNNYAQESCVKMHKVIYGKNDRGQITVPCLGQHGKPKCKDYGTSPIPTLEEMKERFCKPTGIEDKGYCRGL